MPLVVGFLGIALVCVAMWLFAGLLVALLMFAGLAVMMLAMFLMFLKTRDTAAGLHAVTRKDFHNLRDFMNGVHLYIAAQAAREKAALKAAEKADK